MANIKSSEKDIIKSEANRQRNISYKNKLRTAVKKVQKDVDAGDLEKAKEDLKVAISIIDRSYSLHIQKKNTVNRQKRHVANIVNNLEAKKEESK